MADPVQQREILLLLLAAGVVAFTVANRPRLKRLPAHATFLAAFYLLTAGWTLTVLESLFLPDLLNALEHFCYAASSTALAVWCWRTFARREARQA